MCTRPFTVFRWTPGQGARYRTTVICQTCAKLKNVCQGCVLDLEFGLPIKVRDTALAIKDNVAQEDGNREYFINNAEEEMKRTGGQVSGDLSQFSKPSQPGREFLKRMAAACSDPYSKRQATQPMCIYALRNEQCPLGKHCQYRHDVIKNADGTLSSVEKEDKSVTSLFVMNVVQGISKQQLTAFFERFGTLKSVAVSVKSQCAFINFTDRHSAETCINHCLRDGCTIRGKQLQVTWAKPKRKPALPIIVQRSTVDNADDQQQEVIQPGISGTAPPPPPGTVKAPLYPSQRSVK